MDTKEHTLVVIGGGAAGLTASQAAALLGIDVALIEAHRTGGECTWTGCMPSKTLIGIAKQVHNARTSAKYGVDVGDVTIDFAKVMATVKQTIQAIGDEETPDDLRHHNVTVYEAFATFEDANTLMLSDGTRICAKYIILATGAKAIIPNGFDGVPYLTHENLFDLEELPEHLIVIGGGPVGTEMAQAFRRLGSQVSVINDKSRLLAYADEQASAFMHDVFTDEGIHIYNDVKATGAKQEGHQVIVSLSNGSQVTGSHVLIATGKRPNLKPLQPQNAGIEINEHGVPKVNNRLQTTQSNIYLAGDSAGAPYFTHTAGSDAVGALINIISPIKMNTIKATTPSTTFTSPEVAQAGYTEVEAREKFGNVYVTELHMHRNDRAMTEGRPEGFMKLVHHMNGKLYGATIVGVNAGEMMNEWAQVVDRGGYVRDVALSTHIYPTMGSTNAILAVEQLRHQLQSGHWLGRVIKGLIRLLLRPKTKGINVKAPIKT